MAIVSNATVEPSIRLPENADWRKVLPERFVSASDMKEEFLPPLSAGSQDQILSLLRHFEDALKAGERPPATRLLKLKTLHASTILSDSTPEQMAKVKEFLSVGAEVQGRFSRYVAVLRLRPVGSVVTCTLEHKEIQDPHVFAMQGLFFWLFAYSRAKQREEEKQEKYPEHKSSYWGVFFGMWILVIFFGLVAEIFSARFVSSGDFVIPAIVLSLAVMTFTDAIYKRKMKELNELMQAATMWSVNAFQDAMGQFATGKPAQAQPQEPKSEDSPPKPAAGTRRRRD